MGEDKYSKEHIISLDCVRKNIKRYCYGSFCIKEEWVNLIKKYKFNNINNCLSCDKDETNYFNPVRICDICLRNDIYVQK